MSLSLFVALGALAALAACGDAGAIDDGPIRLRGRCDAAERVGGFRLLAAADASFASGQIADRVNPVEVRSEIAAAGQCRLLRRESFFCDPGCGAAEICAGDDRCVPLPVKLDVGDVRITGAATELSLEPRPPGNDYFATDVAHPLFADGAEIRLRGDALSLDGVGSAPLSRDATPLLINRGEPVSLAWDAPRVDRGTAVVLELGIDQHGTTPASLICELADTGSGEIPAELVDALLDAGVSGFPDATMTRATYDRAASGGGCVDLEVGHIRAPALSVDGHTPCDAPGECPDGQTCDLERQTCVAA